MKTKRTINVLLLVAGLLVTTTAQQRVEVAKDRSGNYLTVERNILSGGANRISGLSLNAKDYGLALEGLTTEAMSTLAAKIASDYSEITGIPASSFSLQRALLRKGKWYVDCIQTFGNVPIFGSDFGFTVETNGNIHTLRGNIFPSVTVASATPSTNAAAAADIAVADFLGKHDSTGTVEGKPALFIYPKYGDSSVTYHLSWVLSVSSTKHTEKWQYVLDAQTGEIISSLDIIEKAGRFTNYVNRQFWPLHHYDSPATESGFSNVEVSVYDILTVRVDHGYTDNNGYWQSSVLSSAYYYLVYNKNLNDLSGSYVAITNGDTKTENTSLLIPPQTITKDWVTDETNVFHHVNVIHDFFAAAPYSYATMNYQMSAKVHDGTKNGWSDGTNIGFGSDHDQYWARAADVIYHEYTHCTVHHIYGGRIGTSGQAGAMNEGFPDYFSSVKTNDEEQGESVPVTEYGLPRHLQNSYTMDDFNSLPTTHAKGQIIAGACWDLRQVLSSTDELVFDALFRHSYSFSDFANDVVAEDDDDGNLNNGTPHLETIRSKFYGKKIYFTAGPPGKPQNVSISGSAGQHPTISWSANNDPDLSGYKVYRKVTPDESQFSLVATTTQTSWTDAYVTIRTGGTGGQYAYYYVKAYDASSNLSDASSTVYKPVTNYNPPRVNDGGGLPKILLEPTEFSLEQNHPNPFNPSTRISFSVPEPAQVKIVVLDLLGREIVTLMNQTFTPSYQTLQWHGTDASGKSVGSGVYFCRMTAQGTSGKQFIKSLKMLLVK